MPFNDALDLPEFKDWLVKTIEPLCDADPIVMSDYIMALLKHDAVMAEDEWKIFITRELADFLEDGAKPFVEILFSTLSSKSYLPPAPAPAVMPTPAPKSPPKAPAIVSSYRPPPSGPSAHRITPVTEAGPSTLRSMPTGSATAVRDVKEDVDMADESAGSALAPVSGSGRKKCFDYHEKGYCMRGVNCPYEHSEDVIIPSPQMMFPGFQFMPGPSGPSRGHGNGRGRGRGRGNVQNGPMNGHGVGPIPGPGGFDQSGMPFFPFPFPPMGMASPNQKAQVDTPADFWGSNRPPTNRDSTTLVITDIPHANLTVQAITDYFQQFGEVTHVALEGRSKRALLSFATNREAFQAWKSDEAVFGSRHVKVLWHRPRPGQGEAGQKALEQSAGLVANMKKIANGEGPQGDVGATLSGPESRLQATLAELESRERQAKKETLMAEQKVLLKRAGEASKEEKLKILTRLKELTKEVDLLKNPPKTEPIDVEMSDKERLDQELAKHGMETTNGKDQDELLKLNAQLSALRDKANTLGINASARYSPYSRGSRGRGYPRARGRGRGGPPRPMRLDNRSRTFTLAGDALGSDTSRKAVQDWYESHGGAIEVTSEGMRVTYPTRDMAEKALALGTKEIPNSSGSVSAAWYSAPVESSAPEVEMGDEEHRRGERDEEE